MMTAAILLLFSALPCSGADRDFAAWLQNFKAEAESAGISRQTLDSELSGIAPLPKIIRLDRHQPEARKTLTEYLQLLLSEKRIADGTRHLRSKGDLLKNIENKYGIPGSLLTAFWGIESNYGANTGTTPVIAALATLAFDPRRSAFFKGELLDALRLIDCGLIRSDAMRGSWAGAMGQLQFLPSVILTYKVDQDGDGRLAIWQDSPELFATAAHYLAKSGWQPGLPWGCEVNLVDIPAKNDPRNLSAFRPIGWWREIGVTAIPALPADLEARLLLPEERQGRAFLVTRNFEVLLKWNRSNHYALAVGLLSDAISGP